MSRPMVIDYHVAVADFGQGKAIAEKAGRLGYQTRVVQDDGRDAFTVWCSRSMVPGYESILECQRELDAIAAPHGGKTDGWGTHGNVDGAGQSN